MNQTTKTHVFSKFDFSDEKIVDSKLLVQDSNNICLDQGIRPSNGFSNILNQFLAQSEIETFEKNNAEIINKTIYYFVYEVTETIPVKRIFLLTDDYRLYELLSSKTLEYQNVKFSVFPNFYVFDKKLYILAGDGRIYFCDGNGKLTSKNAKLNLNHVFWYDKRYYFTTYEDKLKVYSSAYDYFEDIYEDTVSYTEFNLETAFGEVLGFQNINNSVYVFQEYKISSVSVNNSGKNLRGEITLSSPILNGTICKIGSVVLFMTRGGIYKFTGSSISQIYSDLNHFENFYKLKTVCFNQKYYILISNSPEDSYLYGLDIMSDGISKTRIDGACDIYSVLTPNHNLLSININKNGVFTTKYLNFCENYAGIKFLKFSPMFFENLSAKFLNEIEISCTGSFSLQIKTEFSMTKFNVSGNFKIENLGLLGKVFEFEISSSEDFEIRYISLAVTYCD